MRDPTLFFCVLLPCAVQVAGCADVDDGDAYNANVAEDDGLGVAEQTTVCAPRVSVFPVRGKHETGYTSDAITGNPAYWTCDSAYSNSDYNSTHLGNDIWAARGTPVAATTAGTLTLTGWSDYSGWKVTIRDSCGWFYFYAHLDHLASGIVNGAAVSAGQIVGYVGNTGTASNGVIHLHYSIYPDSNYNAGIDPWPYLKAVESNVCTTAHDPQGILDFASTPSAGKVRAKGWAFDLDSVATALKVNIYVGGVYAGQLTANQLRTDVDDVYHTGDYHGFGGDLSTIMFGGTRSVCATAINVGGGANKSLGCKSVAFGSLPQKWVDTFANADGRAGPSRATALQGYLYAGTSYVYCRRLGARVSDSSGSYNDWWLLTDLDTVVTGGNSRAWVSAYYLSRWGNNVAKDNSGVDIPNCP